MAAIRPISGITRPMYIFLARRIQFRDFFVNYILLESLRDELVIPAVREAASNLPDDETLKELVSKTLSYSNVGFAKICLEMYLTRIVDNCDLYLASLLRNVFRTRPETMRTDDKVALRDVVRHQTIEELVDWAADRRATELSFCGLADIYKYLREKLGLKLDAHAGAFKAAAHVFEVRNIIVHNGGMVSRMFLSKTKSSAFAVGEPFPLSIDFVRSADSTLAGLVIDIEAVATEHFKLSTVSAGDAPEIADGWDDVAFGDLVRTREQTTDTAGVDEQKRPPEGGR